ncbi:alpha/beta fold hydrolase [Nonomuraea sp. NN258]|uniref:alpha/beta fold hydrolase n=1 Tax=Nonomuraea antri TaxID=2730852 RepID=UPI001569C848|nr:alpha/beta fold hydrolase [Nonomuraea antri]NRQ32009.1 alpha/beta fold hydrolase [Nonomuraea antri]
MNRVSSWDGTSIACRSAGAGPVLVLVGDSRGHDREVAALAGHFTVVGYDRRGRGDSGDTAPYALAREIEDLECVIEAAGGTAFVAGLADGAALALEAARRLPAITRLALCLPPARHPETTIPTLVTDGLSPDTLVAFFAEAGNGAAPRTTQAGGPERYRHITAPAAFKSTDQFSRGALCH